MGQETFAVQLWRKRTELRMHRVVVQGLAAGVWNLMMTAAAAVLRRVVSVVKFRLYEQASWDFRTVTLASGIIGLQGLTS